MVICVQGCAPCMAHKLRKSVLQVALPRKGDRMRTEEEDEDMDGDNADDAADDEGLHVLIKSWHYMKRRKAGMQDRSDACLQRLARSGIDCQLAFPT